MARHGQAIDGSQAIRVWPGSAYGPEQRAVPPRNLTITVRVVTWLRHGADGLSDFL